MAEVNIVIIVTIVNIVTIVTIVIIVNIVNIISIKAQPSLACYNVLNQRLVFFLSVLSFSSFAWHIQNGSITRLIINIMMTAGNVKRKTFADIFMTWQIHICSRFFLLLFVYL